MSLLYHFHDVKFRVEYRYLRSPNNFVVEVLEVNASTHSLAYRNAFDHLNNTRNQSDFAILSTEPLEAYRARIHSN